MTLCRTFLKEHAKCNTCIKTTFVKTAIKENNPMYLSSKRLKQFLKKYQVIITFFNDPSEYLLSKK